MTFSVYMQQPKGQSCGRKGRVFSPGLSPPASTPASPPAETLIHCLKALDFEYAITCSMSFFKVRNLNLKYATQRVFENFKI